MLSNFERGGLGCWGVRRAAPTASGTSALLRFNTDRLKGGLVFGGQVDVRYVGHGPAPQMPA